MDAPLRLRSVAVTLGLTGAAAGFGNPRLPGPNGTPGTWLRGVEAMRRLPVAGLHLAKRGEDTFCTPRLLTRSLAALSVPLAVLALLAPDAALATAGLAPEPLDADHYVRLLATLLNWSDTAGWRDLIVPEADPGRLLRDQLLDLDTALEVDARGLTLGPVRAYTFSVKRYPERTVFGRARRYLGDPRSGSRGVRHNALVALTCHFPDPEAARVRLTAARQWASNLAHGPLVRYLPALAYRFDLTSGSYGLTVPSDGSGPVGSVAARSGRPPGCSGSPPAAHPSGPPAGRPRSRCSGHGQAISDLDTGFRRGDDFCRASLTHFRRGRPGR
jgi:hypothetical protein